MHQVKGIVYFISNNKSTRKSTGKVLLDVEKAFDSIWHNGLIFKFDKFGYLIYLQKMVQSSLNERSFALLKDQSVVLYADDTAIKTKGKVLNAIVKRMKKGLLHAQNTLNGGK